MEDLQGGTLALEHRYAVVGAPQRRGPITSYQGRQDPFDRPIWVRVYDGLVDEILDETGRSERLVDQIKERAQVSSALAAPGVLRVIDYGELEGRIPFVISERSPHESLAEILGAEGTLTTQAACEIVERIGDLLGPIHRQRMAHGGLSAECIYLDPDDLSTLSIGAFQVNLTPDELERVESVGPSARLLEAFGPEFYAGDELSDLGDGPADEFDDEAINQPAHHASNESEYEAESGIAEPGDDAANQAPDEYPRRPDLGAGAMTPSGDVWALGALAYAALVGIHPFFDAARSVEEGVSALATRPARPLAQLGVEAAISEVIMRALSVDPRARYLNGPDFAKALRAARAGFSDDSDFSGESDEYLGAHDQFTSDEDSSAKKAPSPKKASARKDTSARSEATAPIARLDPRHPARDDAPALGAPTLTEREPGPSDRLLSVVVVLLLLSNLAWLFFVVAP